MPWYARPVVGRIFIGFIVGFWALVLILNLLFADAVFPAWFEILCFSLLPILAVVSVYYVKGFRWHKAHGSDG